MHVVVVGAGIMGLSSAWALQRRGFQVTLCDRGSIPNKSSSSYDAHRLIRYPYGRHTGYRALIPEAYEAWDLLWEDLGVTYYAETGTLLFGRPEAPWIETSLADLASVGMAMDPVAPDQVQVRVPGLRLEPGEEAWFSPTGGVLLADRICVHLVRHLEERGVAMRPFHEITRIEPARGEIRFGDGSKSRADAVVVCTGAWPPPDLGEPAADPAFVASRQVVRYLASRSAAWATIPMVLGLDDAEGLYVVPGVSGTKPKIGTHRFTLSGHPDEDRTPTAEEVERLTRVVSRRLPTLVDRPFEDRVCFYAVTPDERFRATRIDRAWYLRGFSGHGFKFGALVGLDLADTVAGHRDEASFLRRVGGFSLE